MKARALLSIIICIQLLLPLSASVSGNSRRSSATDEGSVKAQRFEFSPQTLSGLQAKVEVIQDEFGISHVFAKKTEDAFFMQGFLHARDRFFQMDVTRRTADGTTAELLGAGENNSNIARDVQLRALGLSRVGPKILSLLRPETRRIIKAYTRGINSYLSNNPLPPEYQALKITQKRMWVELDTVNIGKLFAFSQSFDFSLSDIGNTIALQNYQAAGRAQGFDGTALFFEDQYRSAPFDPAFTVPDALGQKLSGDDLRADSEREQSRLAEQRQWSEHLAKTIKPETMEMAARYMQQLKEVSLFTNNTLSLLKRDGARNGSNWFVLSGQNTASGFPMLTADQHFDFSTPPIWYQIQLNVKGGGEPPLNVIGVSIAGTPGVVLGHNDNVAWAATVTVFDVTDVYQEQIEVTGLTSIIITNDGKQLPVESRLESFRVNQITEGKSDNIVTVPPSDSVPARFASIPFRNDGPIVSLNVAAKTALSVQSAALGPSLEIEAIVEINRSRSIKDFQKAIQYLDSAFVNMAVISTSGDIAYFGTGEIPLREDLETGKVSGAPPFFIRDGRGGNDWQTLRKRQFRQALPTDMLPFEEMPQTINPARGFIVNSNNDPAGTTANNNPLEKKRSSGGILYFSAGYDFGCRASRLDREIKAAVGSGKKIDIMQARRFQASGKMRDAEILTPFILQAFENAKKPGAPAELAALATDAGVSEAMGRISRWDFNTPTGLRNGYDSFVPFNQSDPTEEQIASSVATTIYSLWRSQVVRNTLDAALLPRQVEPVGGYEGEIALAAFHNLLVKFPSLKGKGASGIDFFDVPALSGAPAEVRRDFILLQSLRQALDALAGPEFQLAFNGSTNQRDYRWGLIHRGFFPHQFGMRSEFSIPSETGNFGSPIPGLFGIPRDGGYEVPNACSHNVRAKGVNDFMFVHGPSQRFTVMMKPGAIQAVNALPGGQSGLQSSPFHDNLLNFWLVCDVYPFISDKNQLMQRLDK
jgi:penicillin G amidase